MQSLEIICPEAKFLKKGPTRRLTDGTFDAGASAIVIVGNDIYVGEWKSNGSIVVATFWKNVQAIAITDGTIPSGATSIAVIDSDVYAVGQEAGPLGYGVIKYWKNGEAIALTDGTNEVSAGNIVVVKR